jgi:hypothetical protein
VNGALTTGEYTWGTFMRSLAAYAQLTGSTQLADRDLVRTIADIGLLEVRLGGTRFSQLYGALSLRHYGTDLSKNRLWQALTPDEQRKWRFLMDATRFCDPVKREVINLPENYLGVAARVAAMAWEAKLLDDRTLVDSLLDRAAVQFTSGALYADDALPTGRFDRYSNEYVRYVWEAAQIAGRTDLLEALRPSITAQMRLWWDLLNPDGYGYPWGRSLGIVSYLDTLEIAGFLAINPEFRPAPLEHLAAAYHRSWQWLRNDYKDDRHPIASNARARLPLAVLADVAEVATAVLEEREQGMTSDVVWRLDGGSLVRTERLTASQPLAIRRWSVAVPTSASRWITETTAGARVDRFEGREGRLDVTVAHSDWPLAFSGRATEDSALGRGTRGAVPLHLLIDSTDLRLQPGAPRSWTIRLRVEAP